MSVNYILIIPRFHEIESQQKNNPSMTVMHSWFSQSKV